MPLAAAASSVPVALAAVHTYAPPMQSKDVAGKLREKQAWVEGKTIKLNFGKDGIILLDGVSGAVTDQDDPADTTIHVSWDDIQALGRGELDPLSALMQGRLRIDGEMSNAIQLQGVFQKLNSH